MCNGCGYSSLGSAGAMNECNQSANYVASTSLGYGAGSSYRSASSDSYSANSNYSGMYQ